MESQISLLKSKSLYMNLEKEIGLLINLELHEYIDEDLNIDYKIFAESGMDIELLEIISRLLIKLKFKVFGEKEISVGIKNTPENLREYISWFIRFFGYLEANEMGDEFSFNKFHKEIFKNKFTTFKFKTENMRFAVKKIEIEFK